MDKKTGIIIGVIVAVFLVILGGYLWNKNSTSPPVDDDPSSSYELSAIRDLAEKIDYDQIDLNSVLPAQDITGNFPDNVVGSRTAPVVLYEYADYQCSYCAAMNTYINKIVDDYDGKVAVVLRTYILPYHSNGVQAASAANAAALQGYWKKYKDLLFANQNEWFSSEADQFQEQLENYFVKVAGSEGDLEKFQTDMASANVAQKVAFDRGAGDKMDIGGTPWFYLDGEWIENDGLSPEKYSEKLRKVIDQKLADLKR